MVLMQTRAVVSSVLLVRCWTMYSSVNLKLLYGRDVLLELLQGLPAEVAAVHQEQHAPRAGELDQPVDEADGGEGLAASRWPSGSARAGCSAARRLLQVADGGDLRGPELVVAPVGDERRHRADAGEEGGRGELGLVRRRGARPVVEHRGLRQVVQPLGQRLGPVEGEDVAGARLRVEAVGEVRLDAGGLVDERQRAAPGGQRWPAGPARSGPDWISTPVSVAPSFLASITPAALPST